MYVRASTCVRLYVRAFLDSDDKSMQSLALREKNNITGNEKYEIGSIFLHACMHACMHACVFVCMHVRVHVCLYACMYVKCVCVEGQGWWMRVGSSTM